MKQLGYTFIFFCITFLASGQEGRGNDQEQYAAGRMAGQLAISPTGAATYLVPIAVPPGIKDVVPSIALNYNSQGSNGIAGWGWNLAGLSTISRVGATLHHDGIIDPVDFDNLDRFALDGQRLLLKDPTATYGAAETEYQTETYSNLKIIAKGSVSLNGETTPSYFIVYYPDGSRAWYGYLGGRNDLEWAITKWEDPQGNRIDYTYEWKDYLLQIKHIDYGAQTKNNHPNRIRFEYENRTQVQISYVEGRKYSRKEILNKIIVTTKNKTYRSYEIRHEKTTFGYQRLNRIKERDVNGIAMPPIHFNYDKVGKMATVEKSDIENFTVNLEGLNLGNNFSSIPNFLLGMTDTNNAYFDYDAEKHNIIPGDYNGDGINDFVLREGSKYVVFYSDPENESIYSLKGGIEIDASEKINTFLPSTFVTKEGQLLNQQGFLSINERMIERDPSNPYTGANGNYSQMRFRNHALSKDGKTLYEYEKTWDNLIHHNRYNQCGEEKVSTIPKRKLTADFTGDGLTDVLMIEYNRKTTECSGSLNHCQCRSQLGDSGQVFLVDMDRNKKEDFVEYVGTLRIKKTDQIELADFNGDGIPDLWHFTKGKISIYSVYPSKSMELLLEEDNFYITSETSIYMGDFNGDGKTEFMIPKEHNKSTWNLFINKGNGFAFQYFKDLGITYRVTGKEIEEPWYTLSQSENTKFKEFFILPQDADGDGITDLIYQRRNKDRLLTEVFYNRANSDGSRGFYKDYSHTYPINSTKYGIAFGINTHIKSQESAIYYLEGSQLLKQKFETVHRDEVVLQKISHRGRIQTISYQPLSEHSEQPVYKANYEMKYPYVNINSNPYLTVVSKVNEVANNISTTQQFRYYGAVSHISGLGFLGFMGVARTNAYGLNTAALWSLSLHSPKLRGAITHSWSTKLNPFSVYGSAFKIPEKNPLLPQNSFIQKTTYQYLPAVQYENGVFVAPIDNIQSEDALMGFTTHQSFTYDTYFNPTEILTERSGGKTLQKREYINTPDRTNAAYAVGRLKKETTTETWEGTSHRTQQSYTYLSNLLKTQTTYGNGNESLKETYSYDRFGNLTSKTLSASGLDPRTESYTYSEDGRFLKSNTDIAKLTTRFSYHDDGSLESETDPFGNTTTYGYDDWQRPIQTTDYLGNSSSMTFEWSGDMILTTRLGADGSKSRSFTDPWGRTIAEGSLGLDNQWHWVSRQYDAAGRTFKESEPYTAALPNGILPTINLPFAPDSNTTPIKWTITHYDVYGRIQQQRLPTGKSVKTSYTPGKPTTTVDDEYQKISTTLDARGNVAQMTDANGTIHYSYHPTGELLESDFEGHIISVTYDQWGRKASLKDPAVGEFSYIYDTYGQLLEENSPSGTTSYQYNALGQLTNKSQLGENTELNTDYDYFEDSQQLKTQTTLDGIRRETHSYGFTYDDYQRPKTRKEENGYARFEQEFTYDALGRVKTEQRSAQRKGSGKNNIIIAHDYAANGMLVGLQENQKDLWRLKAHNARGQHTQIHLGNGITKNRSYDVLGFLDQIKDSKALDLSLGYNKKQGVLTRRTHNGAAEHFQYDHRNRLTRIQKGLEVNTQEYDNLGRIRDNSQIGEYQYNLGKTYVLDSIILNAAGVKYYTKHTKQTVAYNMDRKAVSVHEVGYGRADFAYNADMQRIHAWYGGEEEALGDRSYEKHYASIFPAEITYQPSSGNTDVVLYVGGDAYSAPIAKINDEIHYLHRDHLGSILSISDASGTLVEERHFGAWGAIELFKQNGQEADFSQSILPRGFTGHEHFSQITLIHMNGRMYDPLMHRFLSPDNFIQDPYNTQSYDRFAYVWNNPLMNNDPTGELAWYVVAAIGIFNPFTSGLVRAARGHEGFFQGFWKGFSNYFKIIGGTLALDSNLTLGQNIVNIISRFTWELPQTIAGLAYNLVHNVTGSVEWVKYKYGATVVKSRAQSKGVALGSFITGSTSIEADANNQLFQHEYGHVLQSRSFGWSYLARVGIPSAFDDESYGRHAFHPVEADANRRAFLYFNDKVDGFQDDDDLEDNKGWNFRINRFPDHVGVKRQISPNNSRQINGYVDYQNEVHVFSLNQLVVRPKWYDYFDPFGIFGIGYLNAWKYNFDGLRKKISNDN